MSSPAPLSTDHRTIGFNCAVDSLNEWLIRRALKNEHCGGSRTYVVCDGNPVVGYYAIAAGSIARSKILGRTRRNMPGPIPALILGRLAVDHHCQGTGIGRGLLKDALARSMNVSEQVGTHVLIVHALNDKAEAFYRKHGFSVCPQIPNTLVLSLND